LPRLPVLFFDLDNTLFPAAPVYALGLERAWERFRREHPHVGVDPDITLDAFRSAYQAARGQVKTLVADSTSSHSRLLYFKRMLENLTGGCRPAFTMALDDAYSRAWEEIPYHADIALLSKLAGKYGIGIITNHICVTQLQKLRFVDPEGRIFSWIVSSEEVGAEKPSAKIYLEALRRAGRDPGDAVMVGDDWAADVEGSLAVGMRAVFLSSAPPPDSRFGVSWIQSLNDLEGVL
jgi:putative hydrolase of the HAD superfamily